MFRKIVCCLSVIVSLSFMLSSTCLSITRPSKTEIQQSNYSSKFIFKSDDKKFVLDLEKIGFDGVDPTTFNRDLFYNWFYQVVEKGVNRPPRSAYFKYRAIIPHVTGRTVDTKKVERWLDNIHDYMNKPNEIPFIWEEPELTTKKAFTLKEKLLASYTTYFGPWSSNRAFNIRLSARILDHYILMPGQIFSFNEVIGKTTASKGYRSAKIIVKGEYKKGLGGGICQTSSTLFNCADKAGFRIVERSTHSRRVTYVPKNRDATVSWAGKDFKFQNQLNEPVLISTNIIGGRIKISIYGPKIIKNVPKYVPAAPNSEG